MWSRRWEKWGRGSGLGKSLVFSGRKRKGTKSELSGRFRNRKRNWSILDKGYFRKYNYPKSTSPALPVEKHTTHWFFQEKNIQVFFYLLLKRSQLGWPRNPSYRNISETYPIFSMKISGYSQNDMGFTLEVSIFSTCPQREMGRFLLITMKNPW